jgi:hypothetical protein
MMPRHLARKVTPLLFVLLAGVLACAGARKSTEDAAISESAGPIVQVRNDHLYEVEVYHVRSGARFRLGRVGSLRGASFPMPDVAAAGGVLQLTVESVGTDATYTTDRILIAAGQSVVLNVSSRLAASSYSLRNR